MSKDHNHNHEKRTLLVVLLTAATMVVEIIYGIISGSMALLADGIHMGSHVLAIGLSWFAYYLIRRLHKSKKHAADEEKILSISGYTSGIFLLFFSFFIIYHAIERFIFPITIDYKGAIYVAIIGLVVNVISAFLLHHNHNSDHNIKAAYLHVLADAVTSLSAIIGLIAAWIWNISYVDTIAAIISSLVIIKWSVGLLKESGKSIINFKKNS